MQKGYRLAGSGVGDRMEAAAAGKFHAAIRGLSPDFMDWSFLAAKIGDLPKGFRAPVASAYREKRENAGQQAANLWVGEVGKNVTKRGVTLAASDAEICDFAKSTADDVRELLADMAMTTPDAVKSRLSRFCEARGVPVPDCDDLRGVVGRLTDAGWWRRALRRSVARQIEAQAIGLGMVHRRAGVYASDETCRRHAEQQQRNAAALAATEATNEEGYTATLAELAEVGVSNPNIRRAELMTRIRGFEDFAREAGHVGMFYTWTAPSRMHARLSRDGRENPKYDGTTPKEAAGFLARQWAKARAWLNRRGLYPYGFRVAEPHHDGTPHWHLLLFVVAEFADCLTDCIKRYACEVDANELQSREAQAARFKAVAIDWERGSAAGYIAKYVCKNIDGRKTTGEAVEFDKAEGDDYAGGAVEGAARVRAWASCWGIRQFQQIGGPGVTIWRELRRLRDVPEQTELFQLWGHADKGTWAGYVRQMGGIEISRADRPAQVWREKTDGKVTRYGEEAPAEICGVLLRGVGYETRVHRWEIGKAVRGERVGASVVFGRGSCRDDDVCRGAEIKRGGLLLGRASGPWTRVNNCTPWAADEGAATRQDADGFALFHKFEPPAATIGPAEAEKLVKDARRSAALGLVSSRRRRGAFGQFPAPPGGV